MNRQICYDKRYNTVLTVRICGSFAAAAARLSLTPSAVAHQVHSLEHELGHTLFTRNGARLEPTRECEVVSALAEQVGNMCAQAESKLNSDIGNPAHLTVGVTPSADSSLTWALIQYANERGNLKITVHTSTADDLSRQLQNRTIDLAVVEGPFDCGSFNSIILDTDFLVVAVPNAHPLSGKASVTLEDIKREKLILRPAGSGTRNLFEANLAQRGLSLADFNVMMEADSVETIKKLVRDNYGISVLSGKACSEDVRAGLFRTLPIEDMNMARTVRLFYRNDYPDIGMIGAINRLFQSVWE